MDFDALWASDKLAACAEWAQAEYAWLYGLADASGSFELTNLRVIWGRVAAIRKNLSLERLEQIFDEFHARGLLFLWDDSGKNYGHWTGSDVPGRLPPPSWRNRLERLAPPVPAGKLKAYLAQFSQSAVRESGGSGCASKRALSPLKPSLEAAPAQELDWKKDSKWKKEGRREEKLAVETASNSSAPREGATQVATQEFSETSEPSSEQQPTESEEPCGGVLFEIYEQERGSLPAARGLTTQRIAMCNARMAGKRGAEFAAYVRDFRAAIQRARAIPFLRGENARGWRADFEWFIAKDENIAKVLAGAYDSYSASGPGSGSARFVGSSSAREAARNDRVARELRAGAGPQAKGRVNAAVLERMRSREAARKAAP